MKDQIFGEITYDVFWETKKIINILNRKYEVLFLIHDYYNDGINNLQRESYVNYEKTESDLSKSIFNILCEYINTRLEYYKEFNVNVKSVNNIEELISIVKPVSYSFMENGDIVIEFDFIYDQENGIGIYIKYNDYDKIEIGNVHDFL